MFREIDTDGSGSVTPEELRGAMATFGLDPHDPSYASILEQADEDGDGFAACEELRALWLEKARNGALVGSEQMARQIAMRGGRG